MVAGPYMDERDEERADPARDLAVDGLLREIARHPEAGDDERFIARVMTRVRSRSGFLRPSPRSFALAAAAVALVATGLALLPRDPSAKPPSGTVVTVEGATMGAGGMIVAPGNPVRVALGDRARVRLDPGAALRVEDQNGGEQVFLESGRMECEVTPAAESFVVRTDAGTVWVKGTRFEVLVTDETPKEEGAEKRIIVTVHEGAVLLTGAEGERLVGAGETADMIRPVGWSRAPLPRAFDPVVPVDPDSSRLGINLSHPTCWVTEYPFVDVFRLAGPWVSQRKGAGWGKGPPLQTDENGWIRRLDPGCWAEATVCGGGHAPAGEYVCLYEGDGEIRIRGARRTVESRPGRIVIESDGGGLFVQIRSTDPARYVRNIRLLMPGHEKTWREQPYNPVFLRNWQSFNTIRFMDWMKTHHSGVVRWKDRPTPDTRSGSDRGVPVEIMVDLCNRLGANPWFCMPHRADDDFVRRFARFVRERLEPDRKVYIEYSSDVWDYRFEQTRHAEEAGISRGLAQRPWEAALRYASIRSVEIFRIWEEVFGGTRRLVRVMGGSLKPHVAQEKLGFRGAYRRCDALAVPAFFRFPVPGRSDAPDRPDARAVANWSVKRLLDHIERGPLADTIRDVAAMKSLTERYGIKLVAFAGGQGLYGVRGGETHEPLNVLFRKANRHPRMGGYYTRLLDAWKETGGDLFCLYASTGNWGRHGCWGLLQYADENEQDQPKFRAVLDWNRLNHK